MSRHLTLGDVCNAWSEILLAFGCRWAMQIFVLLGLGVGIGLGLTLAALWSWR